jgi:hypothetical protein
LFLSFLEEILFALQRRIRGSGDVARPTNFDILVYGLADAAGLVMINDAGHRERRVGGEARYGETKRRMSKEGKRYIMLRMYKREIIKFPRVDGPLTRFTRPQLSGSRHISHSHFSSSYPVF